MAVDWMGCKSKCIMHLSYTYSSFNQTTLLSQRYVIVKSIFSEMFRKSPCNNARARFPEEFVINDLSKSIMQSFSLNLLIFLHGTSTIKILYSNTTGAPACFYSPSSVVIWMYNTKILCNGIFQAILCHLCIAHQAFKWALSK